MWGVSGPFVVEIVWLKKRDPSRAVFDTMREAQAFAAKFRNRPDVFNVTAWDLSGGWQQ